MKICGGSKSRNKSSIVNKCKLVNMAWGLSMHEMEHLKKIIFNYRGSIFEIKYTVINAGWSVQNNSIYLLKNESKGLFIIDVISTLKRGGWRRGMGGQLKVDKVKLFTEIERRKVDTRLASFNFWGADVNCEQFLNLGNTNKFTLNSPLLSCVASAIFLA